MASRAPSHVAVNESPVRPTWLHLQEIKQLIALLDGSDLSEIHIEYPEHHLKLELRKPTSNVTANGEYIAESLQKTAAMGSEQVTGLQAVEKGHLVQAELVGRFFCAQKRDARPLVHAGDIVHEGQVIGYIETLHVMNEVESTTNGRISKIFVTDGQPVEYGQTILHIEAVPEARD